MSQQQAIKILESQLLESYKYAQSEINKKIEETLTKIEQKTGNIDSLLAEKERLNKLKRQVAKEISLAGKKAKELINSNNKRLLRYSVLDAESSVIDQMGMSVDFAIPSDKAISALFTESQSIYDARAMNNLQNTSRIMQRLNNELVASAILGEGIPGLTKRIQNVTNRSLNDSRRIARTQSARMANSGRMYGYKNAEDMGINMSKKWVSTYDGRTRKSHKAMQGETVGLNEEFSNGLRFPGDPNGDASEVINCRCAVSGILADYTDYKHQRYNTRGEKISWEMAELARWED